LSRAYVNPDYLLVTLEGGGTDRIPYAVVEPPLQVFAQLQVVGVEG
jgi:hypothetical protein